MKADPADPAGVALENPCSLTYIMGPVGLSPHVIRYVEREGEELQYLVKSADCSRTNTEIDFTSVSNSTFKFFVTYCTAVILFILVRHNLSYFCLGTYNQIFLPRLL